MYLSQYLNRKIVVYTTGNILIGFTITYHILNNLQIFNCGRYKLTQRHNTKHCYVI